MQGQGRKARVSFWTVHRRTKIALQTALLFCTGVAGPGGNLTVGADWSANVEVFRTGVVSPAGFTVTVEEP